MTKQKLMQILSFAVICAGASCLNCVKGQGASVSYIPRLEKAVLDPNTKKIQIRKGEKKNLTKKSFQKAEKISKGARTFHVGKKGTYTMLITRTDRKTTMFSVKLQKKTYHIRANQPVELSRDYMYLSPESAKDKVIEIPGASVAEGEEVSLWTQGDCASRVFYPEKAGKNKYRLKNAGSGKYLTVEKTSEKYRIVQKTYDKKNKNQIFQFLYAGKESYFIKNVGKGMFLRESKGKITCGKRQNKKRFKFIRKTTSKPVAAVWFDKEFTYPTSIIYGSAFLLKGTLTSRYPLQTVTVEVIDASGRSVISAKENATGVSFDLKKIDARITFGKLPVGRYYYQISVDGQQGGSVVAARKVFDVYITGASASKTLIYNADLIQAIGCQSQGNALEKKACASFALAYCNSILNGTVVMPSAYWVSDTNVNCVWSRGSYETRSFSSEAEILREAYAQLVVGKPAILNVYSATSSEHWITLIGYKNVIGNVISASSFIAIDPWNGQVITLGETYKVKNTYRLGVYIK